MAGHLVHKCGAIDDDTISRYEREASDAGAIQVKYAWVFDTLLNERQRNRTIDTSLVFFESSNFCFTLTDTPGDETYLKNMITGTSQADVGILVMDVDHPTDDAQTKEIILLAYSMGVKQMIVTVNKMEKVDFAQERFQNIRGEVSEFLRKVGYKPMKVPFVPISGWEGDNLTTPSEKSPWYDGPTLLEALDKCVPPKRLCEKPFRMPVLEVYKIAGIGTVAVGRIETGTVKLGMNVIVAPLGLKGVVKSIEANHQSVEEGISGDYVGLNLKGVLSRQIQRGHIVSNAEDHPANAVESITAQVIFMNHPGQVSTGYRPVIDCHTAHVSCEFTHIQAKINRRTGEILEKDPKSIKSGEACIVEMRPLTPFCMELFSAFPGLGRFAVRDHNHTVAVGVVNTVNWARTAEEENDSDDSDEDSD